MKKKKILCVCSKGVNRSKYLAGYLRTKGFLTRYGGTEKYPDKKGKKSFNYLSQKNIDWAEYIIVLRKRFLKILKKDFSVSGKKIFSLDIPGSKKEICKKYPRLKNLTKRDLNKKVTFPKIRKKANEIVQKLK